MAGKCEEYFSIFASCEPLSLQTSLKVPPTHTPTHTHTHGDRRVLFCFFCWQPITSMQYCRNSRMHGARELERTTKNAGNEQQVLPSLTLVLSTPGKHLEMKRGDNRSTQVYVYSRSTIPLTLPRGRSGNSLYDIGFILAPTRRTNMYVRRG